MVDIMLEQSRQAFLHPWLVLVLVLTLCTGMCTGTEDTVSLPGSAERIYVDSPLVRERIRVDVEEKRYIPMGLEALTSYELRVSFVSSTSVKIHFGYSCGQDQHTVMNTRRRSGRKLFHAEKMVFRTDDKGAVKIPSGYDTCAEVMLTMQVFRWGLMRNRTTYFEYDIVLEKNYLGIPVSSAPVLIMAVCLVGLLVVRGVWWWIHVVQPWYLLKFSTEENHKE